MEVNGDLLMGGFDETDGSCDLGVSRYPGGSLEPRLTLVIMETSPNAEAVEKLNNKWKCHI